MLPRRTTGIDNAENSARRGAATLSPLPTAGLLPGGGSSVRPPETPQDPTACEQWDAGRAPWARMVRRALFCRYEREPHVLADVRGGAALGDASMRRSPPLDSLLLRENRNCHAMDILAPRNGPPSMKKGQDPLRGKTCLLPLRQMFVAQPYHTAAAGSSENRSAGCARNPRDDGTMGPRRAGAGSGTKGNA